MSNNSNIIAKERIQHITNTIGLSAVVHAPRKFFVPCITNRNMNPNCPNNLLTPPLSLPHPLVHLPNRPSEASKPGSESLRTQPRPLPCPLCNHLPPKDRRHSRTPSLHLCPTQPPRRSSYLCPQTPALNPSWRCRGYHCSQYPGHARSAFCYSRG